MFLASYALTTQLLMKQQCGENSGSSGVKRGIEQTHQLLPENILVAYTSNTCHDLEDMKKVTEAIKNGVNVLIWVFIAFEVIEVHVIENRTCSCGLRPQEESSDYNRPRVRMKFNLDVQKYKIYRNYLTAMGYKHVKHLVAFGGWNGPHLPEGFTAKELYDAFQSYNTQDEEFQHLFDGIDWDLEGHDNIKSPTNIFTVECLNQMGEFSALAKSDGYIVSMAPPESYLDITSRKFSRLLNLTYSDPWHQDFQYHGSNAYGYLLAKWNDVFDFVFLQFYESYSHAAYQIYHVGQDPTAFLVDYVHFLSSQGEGLFVNFENDPLVGLKNQFVPLSLTKLVFGFANGWAKNHNLGEKTVFFDKHSIQGAYDILAVTCQKPRGLGFWVVEEEGAHGIVYAKDLHSILLDIKEDGLSEK